MSTRSGKLERQYSKYLKRRDPSKCVFCSNDCEQALRTAKHFKVIKNRFAYSLWDEQKVGDHLMIVPLKHIASIAEFTEQMIAEYHRLITEYEQNGYSLYARAPSSNMKSVVHQHTHLIKGEGTARNLIIRLRKPYFRLTV